tara:strand:+ start:1004 stop:1264 length:261 start_codon:yes stop_codon:yes gene_type:complete
MINKQYTEEQSKSIYMKDFLIAHDIATRQEINLVTRINQFNQKTLTDIIKCRTGYDFKEYCLHVLDDIDWCDFDERHKNSKFILTK